MGMDKTYQPQAIEAKWYETWEQQGYFAASGNGAPYCIMIPPPNVTGSLHMGHGFQNTIMDAMIRYHRMQGDNTLWQVGTDHAGIATQMVVERKLAQDKISRHDLGRDEFIQKIWEWKAESGGTITNQLRRLGASVDWERERFTMDDQLSESVQEVFIRLYEEGLIYRGKRLVNWDPKFLTAISDLEVISEEEDGHLWHIRYPIEGSDETLTVATTRPETMLGDTAVAVHPSDDRYQHLIGKQVRLPLSDRLIPIIGDEYVDPEFGSGCVKITPAHDFNDYDVGKRHRLDIINILTPDAHINDQAPSAYQGLERYAARKQVVADLDAAGLLEKIEAHTLKVPRGDRSGVVIEPYLTDQWYVNAEPLAKPAIEAVESGKIRFVPENWTKTYYQWMHNIEDWCISRQLWWGHRIPAWYDNDGNIYVGHTEQAVREKHQLADDISLKQDEDVLDTWFSSALWPFSTLGWPNETPEYKSFYPTSVLVTGFDIIFFWVARMIMMGLKFTDEVPFHEVYIHGLIRDSHGQKMSKSKGNVLDPLDLIDGIDLESLVEKRTSSMMQPHLAKKIEKQTRQEFPEGIAAHGTDALRFTYLALASTGRDIRFDISRLEGYRNFCNKLWNAARYVLMNTENEDTGLGNEACEYSLADRWIQSRLQDLIKITNEHYKSYRFDMLAKALYEFTWNEYCDWYLELSKPVLYSDSSTDAQKRGTRQTLVSVLENLLRILQPYIPYITEEIWQRVSPLAGVEGDTLMLQAFPKVDDALISPEAMADIEWLKTVIVGIRTIRAEMNISPNKAVPVYFQKGDETDKRRLDENRQFLMTLAKLDDLVWLTAEDEAPLSALALAGDMELLIPLKGLIDVTAETARLQKEIEKMQKELARTEGKLSNERFVANAPDDVVAKEKARMAEVQGALGQLNEQMQKLQQLDA